MNHNNCFWNPISTNKGVVIHPHNLIYMRQVKFIQVCSNEMKFTYKGINFLLVEKSYGVYGIGSCVSLYQLDGVKKTFIKGIGQTKSDNHGGGNNDFVLRGIVTFEECKQSSLKYVQTLLK